MRIVNIIFGFVLATTLTAASVEYVGSFRVDEGPSWNPAPIAYSGVEAAAHIWGGQPDEYILSTDPDTINLLAWYTIWGGGYDGMGIALPQDFKHNTNGYYVTFGDVSAYANDWAVGDAYTNYVFRQSTTAGEVPANAPEPGTRMLVGTAAGAALVMGRRMKQAGKKTA